MTTLLDDNAPRLPVPLKRVLFEMRRRGFTQTELSRKSGVHRTTISKILAGRIIAPAALDRIEDAIRSAPVTTNIIREEYLSQLDEISARHSSRKIPLSSLTNP